MDVFEALLLEVLELFRFLEGQRGVRLLRTFHALKGPNFQRLGHLVRIQELTIELLIYLGKLTENLEVRPFQLLPVRLRRRLPLLLFGIAHGGVGSLRQRRLLLGSMLRNVLICVLIILRPPFSLGRGLRLTRRGARVPLGSGSSLRCLGGMGVPLVIAVVGGGPS